MLAAHSHRGAGKSSAVVLESTRAKRELSGWGELGDIELDALHVHPIKEGTWLQRKPSAFGTQAKRKRQWIDVLAIA
jgi:hypothetical protein